MARHESNHAHQSTVFSALAEEQRKHGVHPGDPDVREHASTDTPTKSNAPPPVTPAAE